MEAALRKMKNGKEAGKDQVHIETLKAGDETIAKQLAKLYTKFITERRIHKTWKEANMVIFFSRKGTEKTSRTTDQFACYQIIYVQTEKAFHSVQTQAILTSLQEQGIEDVYVEILKDI